MAGGHRLAVEHPGARCDDPDPVVAGVGDDQAPGGVHRSSVGKAEPGRGGRPAVADKPGGAAPGHGVDVAGGHLLAVERAGAGRYHPDPVVAGVGGHDVAAPIDREALRAVEFGAGGGVLVAGVPGGAGAGDGVDVTGGHLLAVERAGAGRDHPDPAVAGVGDQQIACGVRRHPGRDADLGAGGRAAVAGEALGAGAGDRVDVAGGHLLAVERAGDARHDPDHVVAGVGDDQVPGGVHGQALRAVQPGAGGRAAVAGVSGGAVPGDRVDVAAGHRLAVVAAVLIRDHLDPVGGVARHHQVARGVDRHAGRVAERSAGGGAAAAGEPVGSGPADRVHVAGRHLLAVERAGGGRHHPDPVARRVGDHQVAHAVQGHRAGVHRGAGRRAAVAERPACRGAHRGGQPAGCWVDATHGPVVGDEKLPIAERDAAGCTGGARDRRGHAEVHAGARGRAAHAPGNRGDRPVQGGGPRCPASTGGSRGRTAGRFAGAGRRGARPGSGQRRHAHRKGGRCQDGRTGRSGDARTGMPFKAHGMTPPVVRSGGNRAAGSVNVPA